MIESVKDYAASQAAQNNYAGAPLDGMSVTSPSGVSSMGPSESSLANSVLPHRHGILRKAGQPGDDEDASVKGRKRFSKRHSKNGLAAVF